MDAKGLVARGDAGAQRRLEEAKEEHMMVWAACMSAVKFYLNYDKKAPTF